MRAGDFATLRRLESFVGRVVGIGAVFDEFHAVRVSEEVKIST